ncbi:hypothetical protein [Mesorhizobium sp. NZP2234]|uniref:hypothetical protein n=1 Tax=Mesorhizobium sp. NZP2234 TaxID=2483402 RepID=UPI001FEDFE05|nr:hypothetical protein [Mesorhizobium sp. NZP2234]
MAVDFPHNLPGGVLGGAGESGWRPARSRRVYEVSNDGYISTGGIERVRTVDPLVGVTSLSRQQREAS